MTGEQRRITRNTATEFTVRNRRIMLDPIGPVSLSEAYTAKVNSALAAGHEDLAAELADGYLDELRVEARAESPAA